MSDDEEKIRALKTALFAIECIARSREAGETPRSFDDEAVGFASGIQISVELAREMMMMPLCEIFQIDMNAETKPK